MNETVYLTDLGKCLPDENLSPCPTPRTWQVVDYEAEGLRGKMILAQALVDAPEVMLPLKVKGWHAISIGFWPGIYYDTRFKYRLPNEAIFTVVHHPFKMEWDRTELIETFPRYVDLTGVEGIIFSKDHSAFKPLKACLAYVKLQPLSDKQVRDLQADRQGKETRRIIAINDGEGLFADPSPRTKNELLEQVELYRHSDVEKVLWGANIGDLTYYPSQVGKFYAQKNGIYSSVENKMAVESHHALAQQGLIPFQAVMEHVHSMGLEFHIYYRLAIFDHIYPYQFCSTESFFLKEHPHCRMVAKDGTLMMKASYAFPEVRNFMVSLMEEAMKEDIDGVSLCFLRGPDYFGYEQPVIEDFKKLYGIDPRELPDEDERLLKLRAGYMTDFVRAVRRAADKHADRRNRKMQVSAFIEWSDERMLHFGYDSYTWIKENLLDFIITIGPSQLITLARENSCKIYAGGNSAWPDVATELHVQDMKHAYAAGLDGMALWDLNMVQFLPEKWVILSRLGHREEVLDLPPYSKLYPKMKRIKLLSLAGQTAAHTEGKNNPGHVPPEMLSVFTGG